MKRFSVGTVLVGNYDNCEYKVTEVNDSGYKLALLRGDSAGVGYQEERTWVHEGWTVKSVPDVYVYEVVGEHGDSTWGTWKFDDLELAKDFADQLNHNIAAGFIVTLYRTPVPAREKIDF